MIKLIFLQLVLLVAPYVPFFAFAVIGVSGSFFSYFMPETSGKPLQESVYRKRNKSPNINIQ